MNVEIGAEAALFLEKEFIYGIFVAVYRCGSCRGLTCTYVDCAEREILGTDFLVTCIPSEQTPPFLTLNAEPAFCI
jgi:hypothetical protein